MNDQILLIRFELLKLAIALSGQNPSQQIILLNFNFLVALLEGHDFSAKEDISKVID